ncbi:DUF3850 domain-containing protein [Enterococcus sp. 5B3_DIV0040]|uniref:DUF3850 domain-containing protein n=1 Tax=Enterococcus sp. 5B3_DIV0040 TaxID=1834182 RepID=UPI000A32D8F6|nr:DUF3850 domain-containing protein [Enterococcus sp. 5B3_DIV0040]OTO05096.1 hypothetical protein A5883_002086 [Enterococcus sp. 5B3_DIV0040]
MVHELKILPKFFKAVTSGEKQFEIRKNDRNFQVGDLVILREWIQGTYTGSSYYACITYVTVFGQPPGQVVFGFRPVVNDWVRAKLDDRMMAEKSCGKSF